MGLFSTTHIHQSRTETRLVPYCREVKEFKAPTDESIRLLNEMEQKAKQNIIAKYTDKIGVYTYEAISIDSLTTTSGVFEIKSNECVIIPLNL